jgi:hypothetical protein
VSQLCSPLWAKKTRERKTQLRADGNNGGWLFSGWKSPLACGMPLCLQSGRNYLTTAPTDPTEGPLEVSASASVNYTGRCVQHRAMFFTMVVSTYRNCRLGALNAATEAKRGQGNNGKPSPIVSPGPVPRDLLQNGRRRIAPYKVVIIQPGVLPVGIHVSTSPLLRECFISEEQSWWAWKAYHNRPCKA